jgi:hypothetical protein
MHPARHRIKRQVIELHVAESAARPVQEEISRLYHERIVPLIDQCCTALSAPGLLDRIDRLELDLGAIDAQHLEADLLDHLHTALPAALAAEIEAQRRANGTRQQDPQTTAHLALLTCFVETGTLPWWADLRQPQPVAEAIAQLLQVAPAALHDWLRTTVLEASRRQRLIHHLADAQLLALATLLMSGWQSTAAEELPLLLEKLAAVATQAGRVRPGFRVEVWNHLLAVAAATEESEPTALVLYQALLRRCARDLALPYATLLAQLTALSTPEQTAAQRALTARLTMLASPEPLEAKQNRQQAAAAAQQTELAAPVQPGERESLHPARALDADDEVYIDNAGLVILWPFLGHYFTRLGLLAEQRFRAPAAQQRAAGLLHHVVTGESFWPEYRLPLNKLLCGLELDTLFDPGEPLTPAEQEESHDLLQAVIAQAPILGEMTPAGLQGSFLLRAGVLRSRDGTWLLQVARESYDLVLDRFPWQWQWVQLPWMAAPLRVEW